MIVAEKKTDRIVTEARYAGKWWRATVECIVEVFRKEGILM